MVLGVDANSQGRLYTRKGLHRRQGSDEALSSVSSAHRKSIPQLSIPKISTQFSARDRPGGLNLIPTTPTMLPPVNSERPQPCFVRQTSRSEVGNSEWLMSAADEENWAMAPARMYDNCSVSALEMVSQSGQDEIFAASVCRPKRSSTVGPPREVSLPPDAIPNPRRHPHINHVCRHPNVPRGRWL